LSKRLQNFIVIFSASFLKSTLAMLSAIVRYMIDVKSAGIIESTPGAMVAQQFTEFTPTRIVSPFTFAGMKLLAYQPTTVTTQNPIAQRVAVSDVVQNVRIISERIPRFSVAFAGSRDASAYLQQQFVIAWTINAVRAAQGIKYLTTQLSALSISVFVSLRITSAFLLTFLNKNLFVVSLSPLASILPKFVRVFSISSTT